MGTKKALLIAKEFSDQVKKKYPVDKIYLFGSYAKDGANEGSDIDLCVVSPIFGKDYQKEEMELIKLAMKIDTDISPVPFNSVDINDKWSQLAHEITTYGIQI